MAQLLINRGTTYFRSGTVSVDGVLQDVSNATIRFTVKDSEYDESTDDSTALVTKNVSGNADGSYEIEIEPSDTAEIEPGKLYYDIKVEFADGRIFKLDEGTVKLDGSPTNRLT